MRRGVVQARRLGSLFGNHDNPDHLPDRICHARWGQDVTDLSRYRSRRRSLVLRTAFYWLMIVALAVACVT